MGEVTVDILDEALNALKGTPDTAGSGLRKVRHHRA